MAAHKQQNTRSITPAYPVNFSTSYFMEGLNCRQQSYSPSPVCTDFNSKNIRLVRPKVVAIAKDKYITPLIPFPDTKYLPTGHIPIYGQDITSGLNRATPDKQDVGKTEKELKPKMLKLLDIFADNDKSGMARRLFNAFLQKKQTIEYFEDGSLNTVAKRHQNIKDFCSLALSAPNSSLKAAGKIRIHQALRKANWDINKIVVPTDLGVPAFNKGSKIWTTGDFDNGLGLMINGMQYVYIVAQSYQYNDINSKYTITLRFVFYDVFGLDDDDLEEFGAKSDGIFSSNAAVGITAWWQLQHQYGYVPLITRIVVQKKYEVPAI